MKIKITEAGWTNFTGDFGTVAFENGLSVEDVSPMEATMLAGLVQIECEDGSNPSVSQRVLESIDMPMDGDMVYNASSGTVTVGAEATPESTQKTLYSYEQLAKIADEGGINGLREIGETMGVKSNSIASLITAILDKQSGDTTVAAE